MPCPKTCACSGVQRCLVEGDDSGDQVCACEPGGQQGCFAHTLPHDGAYLAAHMLWCAEVPGREMTMMTKSAPASQVASRVGSRPSSPMMVPAQQPRAAQAGEHEQLLTPSAASSPAVAGQPAKSVKFSQSMPKDIAHLGTGCGLEHDTKSSQAVTAVSLLVLLVVTLQTDVQASCKISCGL